MPPLTLSDQHAIISRCKTHDKTTIRTCGFRQCVVFNSYFIKYGSHDTLKFQYETQRYIYSMAVADPSAPRVPEVVDYFAVDEEMACLVMEFIDATTPA